MDISSLESLEELVPDFEPLVSFTFPPNEHDLHSVLVPVSSTLRALSCDPSILSKATLDYLALMRDVDVMMDPNKLEMKLSMLATKHADLISAVRAINQSRVSSKTDGTIRALPIELLTYVFTLSTVGRQPNTGELFFTGFNMRLRSVCRHWRDFIDNTPKLWACVRLKRPINNIDRLRVALNRSGRLPLELLLNLECIDIQLVSVISLEMNRTRHLGIMGRKGDNRAKLDCVQQLINTRAPLLETFDMSNMPDGYALPPSAPRLQELFVYRCSAMFPATFVINSPNLTRLDLGKCDIWETVDDMVELLRCLPELQYLCCDIKAPIPFESPDIFGSKTVRLPHLSYLDFSLPIEATLYVLGILDIPTSTRIMIQGHFYSPPDANSPEFAGLLDKLRSTIHPHLDNLLVKRTLGYHLSVTDHIRWDDEEALTITIRTPGDSLLFAFSPHDSSIPIEEYSQIMFAVLCSPAVTLNVTSLVVGHDRLLRKKTEWIRLLSQLPGLAEIEIRGPNAVALFRALLAEDTGENLRTLYLCEAGQKCIALMIQTLNKREDTGLPTLKLDLSRCEIEASEYVLLYFHDGVKGIVWDGKTHTGWHSSGADESEEEDEDEAGSSEENMSGSEF